MNVQSVMQLFIYMFNTRIYRSTKIPRSCNPLYLYLDGINSQLKYSNESLHTLNFCVKDEFAKFMQTHYIENMFHHFYNIDTCQTFIYTANIT